MLCFLLPAAGNAVLAAPAVVTHRTVVATPLNPVTTGKTGFSLLPPADTGVAFTNLLTDEAAARNQIRLNGSGVAAGDYDGDGKCDLYFCGLDNANALYRNLGNWRFEDVARPAGVECTGQYSTGCLFAHADGDGRLDLFVTSVGGGTRLFINNGRGGFTEKLNCGLERKFAGTTMAMADVDGDADLDLYVAHYRSTTVRSTGLNFLNVGGKRTLLPQDRASYEITPQGRLLEHGEPDILYLNDGQARFTAVPWTNGNFVDEHGGALTAAPRDWGLTAMFRDMNGDRLPDLYVCNDFHSPDRVWLNAGPGKFRAAPSLAIRTQSTFSMAVDFADIDRDGHDDFIVMDMLDTDHRRRLMQMAAVDAPQAVIGRYDDRPQVDRNTLQKNRGDGSYAEIAQYAGIEATGWSWGVAFMDVDLDGFEDLLMTTGHLFDTQDLDADARIDAAGPYTQETVYTKVLKYPRLAMPKVAFRNRGDSTFESIGAAWGFADIGVAHGIALADLDDDGDLDVVVNNLNRAAGLYRNDSSAPRLAVRLRGRPANPQGTGARITVRGGPVAQSQEMICGGRYLSGDDAMRVFATGESNELVIDVRWRGGGQTTVTHAQPGFGYELIEPEMGEIKTAPEYLPASWFAEAPLEHRHHENAFDDFARQPLLPNRLSQLGPGVSWFDVNDDGWEDLIVGSGRGGRMAILTNAANGRFAPMNHALLNRPITRDQTAVLAGTDSAGSCVLFAGSSNYEDGLTNGAMVRMFRLRDGTVDDTIPGQLSSTGPLALSDIDADGDLDLFVGGRTVPGQYPRAASSVILRNDGGRFVVDERVSRVLLEVGQVTAAVFSDLNQDGRADLLLALEWGPIKLFFNEAGTFTEQTARLGFTQWPGWWNGIATADFDGDGRPDIAAANWGLNTKYRASPQSPRIIYYGDAGGTRIFDVVEAFKDHATGRELPERDLESVAAAMPWIKASFPTHQVYAAADIRQLAGDQFTKLQRLTVSELGSTVFLNRGDRFEPRKLPAEAQWSPAFGVVPGDFNGDGSDDLFLSQNFFATQTQTSRNDAGRSLLLFGDGQGNFRCASGPESGLNVYGEQRGAAAADYDHDGRLDLVVTQNGAETKLFVNRRAQPGLRLRVRGPPGNGQSIGTSVRLVFENGRGPLHEIQAGSGYWSQASAGLVLGLSRPARAIAVRRPGTNEVLIALPNNARDVTVQANNELVVHK